MANRLRIFDDENRVEPSTARHKSTNLLKQGRSGVTPAGKAALSTPGRPRQPLLVDITNTGATKTPGHASKANKPTFALDVTSTPLRTVPSTPLPGPSVQRTASKPTSNLLGTELYSPGMFRTPSPGKRRSRSTRSLLVRPDLLEERIQEDAKEEERIRQAEAAAEATRLRLLQEADEDREVELPAFGGRCEEELFEPDHITVNREELEALAKRIDYPSISYERALENLWGLHDEPIAPFEPAFEPMPDLSFLRSASEDSDPDDSLLTPRRSSTTSKRKTKGRSSLPLPIPSTARRFPTEKPLRLTASKIPVPIARLSPRKITPQLIDGLVEDFRFSL
ncbi:uncharacterized protein L969DRAFT_87382 [Mixia osmundae IAM 14324]|nr:uncharacterized protein L969DRAFT_87382 [Mixia osmundae IAM 14324]KEI39424.1 hypothetical protein L969DRAFT_87382 [Mixia osmundae IAM 14324]